MSYDVKEKEEKEEYDWNILAHFNNEDCPAPNLFFSAWLLLDLMLKLFPSMPLTSRLFSVYNKCSWNQSKREG